MRAAAQVVGVVLLVSGTLVLLGTVVAPALFWTTGCQGTFKSFWDCDVGGLDVAPVIGIMVLSGVIALPWLLLAVAAMAVIGVVAAATRFRNQR